MPRSKRNKIVSLTKTNSKGRALKTKLVEELREAIDEYKSIYLFSFENMRASKFKDVRMDWRESKIFMGKNTIAQIALGRTPEEEYKDNLRLISKDLEGNVGLLFTSRDKKEVKKYFSKFCNPEFAKAGAISSEDIVLQPGKVDFPVSMVDELRKLGLIVEVDDTQVVLMQTFTVATAGVPITPDQAKVLVKLNRKIIDFKINLVSTWTDGKFTEL